MKQKNKESIINMLSGQYLEEIHEVVLECEHHYKTEIDIGSLNNKLDEVYRSAIIDGLPHENFIELIEHSFPQYFSQLSFGKKVVAA
ncbi:MAG: hypothetical protein ACOYL6_16775 [Bacteriovoracaceae bacterium]